MSMHCDRSDIKCKSKILNKIENNILINYNLEIICLVSVIGLASSIYFLYNSSYFNSTDHIHTPDSPPTFNFTHNQIRELNELLDSGVVMDKETSDKLDQDIKTMMGEEDYNAFTHELEEINNQFISEFNDILDNIDKLL